MSESFYLDLPPVSWYPRLLVSTLLGEEKDTLPKAPPMQSVWPTFDLRAEDDAPMSEQNVPGS
jgi:hypothetical protein